MTTSVCEYAPVISHIIPVSHVTSVQKSEITSPRSQSQEMGLKLRQDRLGYVQ